MKLNYWNVLAPVSDHSITIMEAGGWYWLFIASCIVCRGRMVLRTVNGVQLQELRRRIEKDGNADVA